MEQNEQTSDVNTINNSIFTPEEMEALTLTRNVRINIIKSMTPGDTVPVKSGDIRVLNEVMGSLDKNIQEQAANRLKYQDTQNSEEVIGLVAEMLRTMGGSKDIQDSVAERDLTLPAELSNITLVPGQTDINPEPLLIEDFVRKN